METIMLTQTQTLKARLEKIQRNGYKPVSPLRPGQESIMVIRSWKSEAESSFPQTPDKAKSQFS